MNVFIFDDSVKQFLKNLRMPTSAKVFRIFELLEQFGHALRMPHSKHIGGKLFELRVRGHDEIRLLYTFHKDTAIILHGFFKKSQKTPTKEIRVARQKLFTLDKI